MVTISLLLWSQTPACGFYLLLWETTLTIRETGTRSITFSSTALRKTGLHVSFLLRDKAERFSIGNVVAVGSDQNLSRSGTMHLRERAEMGKNPAGAQLNKRSGAEHTASEEKRRRHMWSYTHFHMHIHIIHTHTHILLPSNLLVLPHPSLTLSYLCLLYQEP